MVERSLSMQNVLGLIPGSSSLVFLHLCFLPFVLASNFIALDFPTCSGEMVPAFERVLEVPASEADKLSNVMKYYKKVGYIRPHRRLYNLVKKYYHKDKVSRFKL